MAECTTDQIYIRDLTVDFTSFLLSPTPSTSPDEGAVWVSDGSNGLDEGELYYRRPDDGSITKLSGDTIIIIPGDPDDPIDPDVDTTYETPLDPSQGTFFLDAVDFILLSNGTGDTTIDVGDGSSTTKYFIGSTFGDGSFGDRITLTNFITLEPAVSPLTLTIALSAVAGDFIPVWKGYYVHLT